MSMGKALAMMVGIKLEGVAVLGREAREGGKKRDMRVCACGGAGGGVG